MEFKTLNRGGTPHYVVTTTEDDHISLTVTRLEMNGGIPKHVKRKMPLDSKWSTMVDSITRLIELDTDLFNLVCETMKQKESDDASV